MFLKISNFNIIIMNKWESDDWGFVLKVGATIIVKNNEPFDVHVCFVSTHTN
jgi:hypothetical protein